ncbi:uncharacterized protein BXZ73DRAFT_99599 [Epithele typhae]|uniref:uncharacterized protein n=1 Tax=Epithele typhae TaxID=378194 RepID=UPI002008BB49|nr:uncharacterized protein BXZ73DRAFT_99599 [Epithele typhae]KAH9939395.1 hypothetical protein BXZ73DRAFT_99599 [Epithele typhae]
MSSLNLLCLYDDVLLCMFAFLCAEDATRMALTAKRPYVLALPFALADIHLTSAPIRRPSAKHSGNLDNLATGLLLRRLEYLQGFDPILCRPRSSYIRHLSAPQLSKYLRPRGSALEVIERVTTLLFQTLSLRSLTIPHFSTYWDQNLGFVERLADFKHIHTLVLPDVRTLSEPDMRLLPDLSPSSLAHTLCSLTVRFTLERDIGRQERVARMVARLRNFPALRTLHLSIASGLSGHVPPLPPSNPRAILENIRDLTIHGAWRPQPVPDCPNINDLTLEVGELRSQSEAGFRWPALRTLAIVYDGNLNWPTRVDSSCITRASRLWFKPSPFLTEDYDLGSRRETGKSFAKTLPGLSTVLFSCTLYWFYEKANEYVDDDDDDDNDDNGNDNAWETRRVDNDIWDPSRLSTNEAALAQVAARLRSLHLEVHHSAYLSHVAPWDTLMTALPNVLAAAPLVHLTLILVPRGHKVGVAVPNSCHELARVRAAREIPRRLAEAIETLRVLQVGDAMPDTTRLPPHQVERGDHKGEMEEWERCVQEMAAMEVVRRRRWWWIEREDGNAVMTEIWREDGERARDLVEDDGFDRATGLDGFFTSNCVYEP